MKYFEDLLNKIKRHISGYKEVHIDVVLHFSEKEWDRFIKEYNPALKKDYRMGSSNHIYVAKLQIAGLNVTAFSPFYPNTGRTPTQGGEKRSHELYQKFLKERKELGCLE